MPECGRMTDNLVHRLRSPNSYGILNTDPMSNLAERTMLEAGDRIEALEDWKEHYAMDRDWLAQFRDNCKQQAQRIEALEAALRLIAGTGDHHSGATMAVYARRALEGK